MARRSRTVNAGVKASGGAAAATAELPAPRSADWTPLGQLLVQHDLITHGQLAEVLLQQAASGKRLGTLLVELGVLDERHLASSLAEQFDLPLVDLRANAPEPGVADLLPESLARSLSAVPLGFDEDDIVGIALADPQPEIRQQIAGALGRQVEFVVASSSEVRRTIDQLYRAISDVDDLVKQFEMTEAARARLSAKASDAQADDAPVVQVVNRLITQALRDRASDLHIEPQDDRVRIRFRIDGSLHDVLALPSGIGPGLVSRLKIMAGM